MRADLVWWDLDGAPETLAALRAQLRADGVGPWPDVPGLRLKLWLSDPDQSRWGAVMVWQDERPDAGLLPPNVAADLIGRPPDHRIRFEVEAVAEGTAAAVAGTMSGTALEGRSCTST